MSAIADQDLVEVLENLPHDRMMDRVTVVGPNTEYYAKPFLFKTRSPVFYYPNPDKYIISKMFSKQEPSKQLSWRP